MSRAVPGQAAPRDGASQGVFRLVLEYDGSAFEGWQAQPGDHRTVQGCLVGALEKVAGGQAEVVGAGRTDSGVHAEGQVASVRVATRLAPDALQRALNGVLPRDLVVRSVALAPDDFDARRWAKTKLYRYRVWNGRERSPLRAHRSLYVPQPLDLAAMQRAGSALVGEHDFSSFRAAGSPVRTSVRTLRSAQIEGAPGQAVRFEFVGTGFLRHMVRNLVGTLLEVGQGRRDPGTMAALLEARDRGQAGPTAAAHGLCLVWVDDGLGEEPPFVGHRGLGEESHSV